MFPPTDASRTDAALAAVCPDNGEMCFQWGSPAGANGASPGVLYFQLRAPASLSWFALGTGSSMAGSSMFVVYRNGSGVTLSTRQGTGHSMPQFEARSDVQLLPGSGVVNGNLVANVRCAQCSDIPITSSSKWISAWAKKGPATDSSSASEPISIHDAFSSFSVNLQQATITSDSNPFLTPATNGGTKPIVNGVETGADNSKMMLYAHGIIMAGAFLLGYPIGSAVMPLLSKWIVHASWQLLAFTGMWVGFALGYIISSKAGSLFQDAHTQIGLVVSILMTIQPVLGWLHHERFLKHRRRGPVSHVHIWLGRVVMLFGIIDGGIGLQSAGASSRFITTYSVVAALVSVMYLVGVTFGRVKKKWQRNQNLGSSSLTELGKL
ncbi:uncharacterized protein MAM_01990 [Metarhizium album ARSEF 1941]|uniref:Integral membrane protein n=1 Tax=Metarhizium album (strain ARSEF 1941) TaxID=1081103 RepID=A0A0B2WVC6_METAS|nr:uncharacterized protein MAM_01990 [Metarhizium album ARSEF 1941]KHO00067.1 integral membrane protein [Metarhizium album ARSEF 1941]